MASDTESFEASKCFCSFEIAHEGSYPCSRIHQAKNNELNWHASLPKASLVETHVWITHVSTLHVQYDFGKASVSLWPDTLCSQRRRRYEVQTPSRQKACITCPSYWRKGYAHVSLFNLLCLFSPKAPRLTRRGRLRLSFQFRMEIEKHDKKLASFPGIYNHSLGVREGAVSRYFSSGSTNFGSNLGPFLLCNSHLPHLDIVIIWLYPGIVD